MNFTQGESFYFHQGWHFLLADIFPIQEAMESFKDQAGHYFYELDYEENNWEEVTLPHTFNDVDLFKDRIQDAGSGQKRTTSFYRNWLTVPKKHLGQKVILEFEGVRQTCYVYVNGNLAGYYEAGVAPFGFDISKYIQGEKNLIAIVSDNTSTRNIPFCSAETPNKPDVTPGSYIFPQESMAKNHPEGINYFWNCNDFNPSVGGLTRPVKVHFKPLVYLTLPLYSNLETKGVYVYGKNLDVKNSQGEVAVSAELRNESKEEVSASLKISLYDQKKNLVNSFSSKKEIIQPVGLLSSKQSIIPEDAYEFSKEKNQYVPVDSLENVTPSASFKVQELNALSAKLPLRFWDINDPYLYNVKVELVVNNQVVDSQVIETGFRKVFYDNQKGLKINDHVVWLRGYAQRATNEWAACGIVPEWLKDYDAKLIKESNANHIRFMHVAGSPGDVRAYDRHGIVLTQPAGDKEKENFGRQWNQRVELMRDVLIYFRNHPSIIFWEAGNNSISKEHMKEMRLLKEKIDPYGERFMGCRTLNTEDVVNESEYVGTMLNRHAARFLSLHGPVTETEYSREESPRRIWDDFTPPYFDYPTKWVGKGGKKQIGTDFYDLTSEDLALANARGYAEFFNDRLQGASKKDLYSATAALCWTDSAQHGRQSFSENGRMSGRVDPIRLKKQSFDVFSVMQNNQPAIKIIGHWNYPPNTADNYNYPEKEFNGEFYAETENIKRRNPLKKTVYVVGSYPVAKVSLFINGKHLKDNDSIEDTFIFSFKDIDVTQSGEIEAIGYDYEGNEICKDKLVTVKQVSKLLAKVQTSPEGFLANGQDIAFIDLSLVDEFGNISPLADNRIDFSITGPGVFLGGYNSGKFVGFNHDDSVIHENHVFAECGINRIFIRSLKTPGEIKITAKVKGLKEVNIILNTLKATNEPLDKTPLVCWYEDYLPTVPKQVDDFIPNKKADEEKYIHQDKNYSKILINGQEPDTRGVPTVNENGRIWGNVMCILERLQDTMNNAFSFKWDEENKKLTVTADNQVIEAEVGKTHLLVNGEENLMDGQPYLTEEGQLVMEVNALIPFIPGTKVLYDDLVNVLRIEV